jgi:hypothetical protein
VAATRRKIIRENMKRHCMAESHDAAAAQRSNNNASKKRKRHGWQHNISTVCHNKEMTNAIKHSMKKAKQILHEDKILQILSVIGQLWALYVIDLLLAQRQFTNLQITRFPNTAIDSLFKYTKHTMGKS